MVKNTTSPLNPQEHQRKNSVYIGLEPAVLITEKPAIENLPTVVNGLQQSTESEPARKLYKNVVHLGISFSLVFTGYHVAQSFVTTVYHGAFGFTALGIVYGSYAISSFLAPIVHQYAEFYGGEGRGEKLSMIVGSLGYIVFIITLAIGKKWLFIIGCVIKGLSSGLLWISEGVWLTKSVNAYKNSQTIEENNTVTSTALMQECSDDPLSDEHVIKVPPVANQSPKGDIVGAATGLFFTLFNLNGIVGNFMSLIILGAGVSVPALVWCMAIVAGIGSSLLTFTSDAPASRRPSVQENNEKMMSLKSAFVDRWLSIKHVATQSKTLLLTPYFICQGVHLAYTYGNFPNFLNNASAKNSFLGTSEHAGAMNIAAGFLLYGVGSMAGAYGWGKVYDAYHGSLKPLITAHWILLSLNASLLLALVLTPFPSHTVLPCLLFVGFNFGLLDFLVNAIANNSISKFYPSKDVPSAFGWYRISFCFGFALSAGIGSLLPIVGDGESGWDCYGWITMLGFNYIVMIMSLVTGSFAEQSLKEQRRQSICSVQIH